MGEEKIESFKCVISRKIFGSIENDYKIYAVHVDTNEYPNIKRTKYGTATIVGDMHELDEGAEYTINAIGVNTDRGYNYQVKNIIKEKPNDVNDMYVFLQEILTLNQAETLYNNYPDIVDRVIKDDLEDIDLDKLKGIGKKTFEKIVLKINENYGIAELVAEFKGSITFNMLKKMHSKYPSLELIKQKLKKEPYKSLCNISRVGFITADKIILSIEKEGIISFNYDMKTSRERCLACITYFIEEAENDGHTKVSIKELREECLRLTPDCIDHFVSALKDDSIYYDKETMFASKNTTYHKEVYIADAIKSGLEVKNEWHFDREKCKKVDEFDLSGEQKDSIENLFKNNISILNGGGGTGKSYSTKVIINLLDEQNKTYMLLSPTGKAAKVLSEYTGKTATTIHRGLGYNPANGWAYNKENKLFCDLIIIDEFSMVDIPLFCRVIDAMDFNKTKLLLIGDNAQLPSVMYGNLMHDFMMANVIPTTTLTKVFRYKEGGLDRVAADVRNSKKYLSTDDLKDSPLIAFGESKDYTFINAVGNDLIDKTIAVYRKILEQDNCSKEDIQILTAYNKGEYGSVAFNNRIQKIANKENYYSKNFIKNGDTVFYENDIVLQTKNNYRARKVVDAFDLFNGGLDTSNETFIANGETGVIKMIDHNKGVAHILIDDTLIEYSRNDFNNLSLGYAISIHKSQGSGIKKVILITPSAHTYMLNSNLIYVGISRTKQNCYHLGSIGTLNTAIKKKANLKRNTYMQELLKDG